MPVSAPVALTVAPAMMPPELSSTVPPIAPRSDWPAAGFPATSARIPLARITRENRSQCIAHLLAGLAQVSLCPRTGQHPVSASLYFRAKTRRSDQQREYRSEEHTSELQ